MTILYRRAVSKTDANITAAIGNMLVAKANLNAPHVDESNEAADARFEPYWQQLCELAEMRPDSKNAYRQLLAVLFKEEEGNVIDERAPFFKALLNFANDMLDIKMEVPPDDYTYIPRKERPEQPVDPLTVVFNNYVETINAFDDPTQPDRSDEESDALADATYRFWEKKLENPGKIQSMAGAHAVAKFLEMDNNEHGQEVWRLAFQSLVEFLGERVPA